MVEENPKKEEVYEEERENKEEGHPLAILLILTIIFLLLLFLFFTNLSFNQQPTPQPTLLAGVVENSVENPNENLNNSDSLYNLSAKSAKNKTLVFLAIDIFLLLVLLLFILLILRRSMVEKSSMHDIESMTIESRLKAHIKNSLVRGMSKHEIMKQLLDVGWDKAKIYETIKRVEAEK